MQAAQIIKEIRLQLKQLEDELATRTHAPAALIAPGDIVQIRPEAEPTFGGMLLHVCRVRPAAVDGYLLRPHRGGCREAWHHFTPPELVRLGPSHSPQPEFARRP